MVAWLLVYSWMQYGEGSFSWYELHENVVPGIASEEDCKNLGKKLTALKERPKFLCEPYKAAGTP